MVDTGYQKLFLQEELKRSCQRCRKHEISAAEHTRKVSELEKTLIDQPGWRGMLMRAAMANGFC